MILRPFNLKKVQKSISTLSPKGSMRPAYMRFKPYKDKSSRGQRSLCSIDTYRQSSSLGNKKMLSHRKLISVSSIEHKQNLTDRKCANTQTSRQRKKTVQSQHAPIQSTNRNPRDEFFSKKRFHFSKFAHLKSDRLNTIQNEQSENIQKVLQIKENILKEFINRFEEELKQISQKKSSRKTLLTHRMKTQNPKQQTTKKPRTQLSSLQSNRQTLNLSKCIKNDQKQTQRQYQMKNVETTRFEQYIRELKEHKKKDQKIFIMKNHKRSLQNISISKIGQTENVTSQRIQKIEPKNNKLNLKQLFKHSKKYEPYLKDCQSICLNPPKIPQIKESESKFQKSSLKMSPIQNKQNLKDPSVYIDCSSISNLNQSSFISDVGRKSLLKHLSKESAKLMKDEQKKSKRCLAKMKNIFPSDFF